MVGDRSETDPPGANHAGLAGMTEALRASPELGDVAGQLLLTLFPDRRLLTAREGRWVTFSARPALGLHDSRRLLDHLHALVVRPEWRGRHAVAREVVDARGRRVEAVVPVRPEAYDGGDALVGPFPDEESVRAWYAGVRLGGLAADTLQVEGAWLCDLFLLDEPGGG